MNDAQRLCNLHLPLVKSFPWVYSGPLSGAIWKSAILPGTQNTCYVIRTWYA